MALNLILNQPYVTNGLVTATFTIPVATAYSVQVQSTFPSNPAINSVASAVAGIGYGAPGPVGAGSGMGLGAGTGGGGEGFTGGDLGLGHGGVGQGFGVGNAYQQPPAAASNAIAQSPVTSGLSIVVNQNGSPIYTFSSPAVFQSAVQFKFGFLAAVNDTITIVSSSAVLTDEQLSGVLSTFTIQQGF